MSWERSEAARPDVPPVHTTGRELVKVARQLERTVRRRRGAAVRLSEIEHEVNTLRRQLTALQDALSNQVLPADPHDPETEL